MIANEKESEIRGGKIICQSCKISYSIEEGILNLILYPSKELIKEQNENLKTLRKKRLDKNDEWLLSLPLAGDFGNEKYPIINRGYLANIQMLICALGPLKNKKALDIGAGTCWTTNLLAEKDADCVAMDISAEKYIGLSSADVFFKYRKTYFERVLNDMNTLPFRDQSFDIVFTNASVHHAQNLDGVIQEASRVLKEGGRLVLSNEPCCSVFKLNKQMNISKAKKSGMDVSEGWNEMIYSLFQYKKFVKKAGFQLKILYPAMYDIILQDQRNLDSIYGMKHYLARILYAFYQMPLFKKLFVSLYLLYLIFLGGPIIALGKKK